MFKSNFKFIPLPNLFNTARTKEILSVNPTILPQREDAREIVIHVYNYTNETFETKQYKGVEEIMSYKDRPGITWINVDGLRKADVEAIALAYDIHPLVVEDVLSINQRPKMDETEGVLFCLLNMLYFNEVKNAIEQEQISILLGENFVITFQEDPKRDVFDLLRERMKMANSKIRQRGADYLCYTMLDLIVDQYFFVMEKLGEHIEDIEEEVIRKSHKRTLAKISRLKKELIIIKRNFSPVRDLISGIIRSESELLEERTTKYFKDIYDHIMQAIDLSENYRDVMMGMQDLYVNNVNLRMNEVMKVMAIVTCLLAPATVIGGIFGMNFDENVNFFHQPMGFYLAVSAMLIIPLIMLFIFRKRGWF